MLEVNQLTPEAQEKIRAIRLRQQKAPSYFTRPKLKEKCEICGDTEILQRHHIQYEPPEVITVCYSCHCFIHNRKLAKNSIPPEQNSLNRKRVNHNYYLSIKKPKVKHIEIDIKKIKRAATNHKYYIKNRGDKNNANQRPK